jgi:hypothetical protein
MCSRCPLLGLESLEDQCTVASVRLIRGFGFHSKFLDVHRKTKSFAAQKKWSVLQAIEQNCPYCVELLPQPVQSLVTADHQYF